MLNFKEAYKTIQKKDPRTGKQITVKRNVADKSTTDSLQSLNKNRQSQKSKSTANAPTSRIKVTPLHTTQLANRKRLQAIKKKGDDAKRAGQTYRQQTAKQKSNDAAQAYVDKIDKEKKEKEDLKKEREKGWRGKAKKWGKRAAMGAAAIGAIKTVPTAIGLHMGEEKKMKTFDQIREASTFEGTRFFSLTRYSAKGGMGLQISQQRAMPGDKIPNNGRYVNMPFKDIPRFITALQRVMKKSINDPGDL